MTKGKTANFRADTLREVEKIIGTSFEPVHLKQRGYSAYESVAGDIGLVCIISKKYEYALDQYWFSFHPYQKEMLEGYKSGFVAMGCGSPKMTILVPMVDLFESLPKVRRRESGDLEYWFLQIANKDGKYLLQTMKGLEAVNLTKYLKVK